MPPCAIFTIAIRCSGNAAAIAWPNVSSGP
ncbi:hypothetical protein SCE1572_20125 [Sorangium cellulosum So0157-2]|uniref:Uncharacterized protein n=1 Tax=Sorangium cellulosum So0157-2 TaxID=1254432 RepID=S4Y113_SORCE|nr:hypothetical protein SCE1572_20125 [Sorangium cellulosum So0157-2]